MRTRRWKLILPHGYRTLGGRKPGMDGWPGESQKQPVLQPELYDMQQDMQERQNVAEGHPEVVQKLLGLAEQCREDLGDLITHRKGSGVRGPGR